MGSSELQTLRRAEDKVISFTFERSPGYLKAFREAYMVLMQGAGRSVDRALLELSDADFYYTLKANAASSGERDDFHYN